MVSSTRVLFNDKALKDVYIDESERVSGYRKDIFKTMRH